MHPNEPRTDLGREAFSIYEKALETGITRVDSIGGTAPTIHGSDASRLPGLARGRPAW